MFRVLFIGDVVGGPGLAALARRFRGLVERHRIDFSVVNADNLTDTGRGINPAGARSLLGLGVDVLTTGNHVWKNPDAPEFIRQQERILRPLNLPGNPPGNGSFRCLHAKLPGPVCVLHLAGRVFMNEGAECPFLAADQALADRVEDEIVLVDFHAEATSEKVALGWYLDGRVGAVIGTHTHVQTADERVLPDGTAYITDAGMTGPHDSVLGFDKRVIIPRFVDDNRQRFRVAEKDVRICGVIIDIDPATARAQRIERLAEKIEDAGDEAVRIS